MNRRLVARSLVGAVGCAVISSSADRALGCAVCFGDPDSPMAKGAVAGVLVLVGIVGTVLLGMVGTGLFWIQRSRRLERQHDAEDTPITNDRHGDA